MFIPRLCLLLIAALIPLLGGRSGVVTLAVFAVLATGGWIGWAAARPGPAAPPLPLRLPLLALVAVTLLSAITSVYVPASVLGLWQVVALAAIGLLALVTPLQRRHLFAGAAAFSAAAVAGHLYGFYSWYTWYLGRGLLTWRVQSTWENANFYAGFLAMTLPLLAVLACHAPRRAQRVLLWLAACLGLAAIVLSQSRGGLLAFFGALLFFAPAWLWARGALSARGIALVAAGLLVFAGLALASPVGKRVLDPELRAKQLHSQMFRYYTWQGDLRMAKARPLAGTGPNTFPSAFGQYQLAGYTRQGHQIYLQAAAETGVIGLSALLWLFGAVIALGIRAMRAARADLPRPERVLRGSAGAALLAGTLGLMLHGLVDSDWNYAGIQLALLLQAALVWQLAGGAGRGRSAPAWARALIPMGLGVMTIFLLVGARAEQAMANAERAVEQAQWAKDDEERMACAREAVARFREGVSWAPTNAAYLRKASSYLPRGEAGEYLARALRAEPANAANWLYLGHYHLRNKEYRQAMAAYRTAERKQPRLLPALYGLARAAWAAGDARQAREAVARVLGSIGSLQQRFQPVEVPEPWYVLAWYAEGDLAARAKEPARAATAFSAAIAAADAYERGYAEEAEAWAYASGNTGERAKMRTLASLCHQRLADLLGQRDPAAARHRAAMDPALPIPPEMRDTPFP